MAFLCFASSYVYFIIITTYYLSLFFFLSGGGGGGRGGAAPITDKLRKLCYFNAKKSLYWLIFGGLERIGRVTINTAFFSSPKMNCIIVWKIYYTRTFAIQLSCILVFISLVYKGVIPLVLLACVVVGANPISYMHRQPF